MTALPQSMSSLPSELDAAEFSSAAQELADIMPRAALNTRVRGRRELWD